MLALLPCVEHGIEAAEEAGEQGEDERLQGGRGAPGGFAFPAVQTQLRRQGGEGGRQRGRRRGRARGRDRLPGVRCTG